MITKFKSITTQIFVLVWLIILYMPRIFSQHIIPPCKYTLQNLTQTVQGVTWFLLTLHWHIQCKGNRLTQFFSLWTFKFFKDHVVSSLALLTRRRNCMRFLSFVNVTIFRSRQKIVYSINCLRVLFIHLAGEEANCLPVLISPTYFALSLNSPLAADHRTASDN